MDLIEGQQQVLNIDYLVRDEFGATDTSTLSLTVVGKGGGAIAALSSLFMLEGSAGGSNPVLDAVTYEDVAGPSDLSSIIVQNFYTNVDQSYSAALDDAYILDLLSTSNPSDTYIELGFGAVNFGDSNAIGFIQGNEFLPSSGADGDNQVNLALMSQNAASGNAQAQEVTISGGAAINVVIASEQYSDMAQSVDDYLIRLDQLTMAGMDVLLANLGSIENIFVAQPNNLPTLDPIADITVNELDMVSFTANAQDQDATDVLRYSLVGAPAGAIIDEDTGQFMWDTTELDDGQYTFDVQVSDGRDSVLQSLTINVEEVNQAPVFPNNTDFTSVLEGDFITAITTATDADVINGSPDVITYSLVDGSADWLSIDPVTGLVSGTTPEVDEDTLFNIDIVATDQSGAATVYSGRTTVLVQDVEEPLVSLGDLFKLEGIDGLNSPTGTYNELYAGVGPNDMLGLMARNVYENPGGVVNNDLESILEGAILEFGAENVYFELGLGSSGEEGFSPSIDNFLELTSAEESALLSFGDGEVRGATLIGDLFFGQAPANGLETTPYEGPGEVTNGGSDFATERDNLFRADSLQADRTDFYAEFSGDNSKWIENIFVTPEPEMT